MADHLPAAGQADGPAWVALIPARLASTRLPDKPLADIGGQPMVVRVAELAARSGAARVVVATDSARVFDAVQASGIEVLMTRADHPSGTDRLAEAAAALGLAPDSVVVNVQGDEPLMPPALIARVAQALLAHPAWSIATAAHPIDSVGDWLNPNVVKVITDALGQALYFSRSPLPFARDALAGFPQRLPTELPPVLHGQVLRHIGLYAYRVGFLQQYPGLPVSPLETLESLEQLRALWNGHRIGVEIAEQAPATGVDTPEDLERVRQAWMTHRPM